MKPLYTIHTEPPVSLSRGHAAHTLRRQWWASKNIGSSRPSRSRRPNGTRQYLWLAPDGTPRELLVF